MSRVLQPLQMVLLFRRLVSDTNKGVKNVVSVYKTRNGWDKKDDPKKIFCCDNEEGSPIIKDY